MDIYVSNIVEKMNDLQSIIDLLFLSDCDVIELIIDEYDNEYPDAEDLSDTTIEECMNKIGIQEDDVICILKKKYKEDIEDSIDMLYDILQDN